MSKRFYSFKSSLQEPLRKKSSNGFVPWKQNNLIPDEVKKGNIKEALTYVINLNATSVNHNLKIALKHQLYSVVENRTNVDRGVNALLEKGDIKLFKTSLGDEQLCIMFTKDYYDHVKMLCLDDSQVKKKNKVIQQFLDFVLPDFKDISINENVLLKKHGFQDTDVTKLIEQGILTVKNAGTWWLSIPNLGQFLKVLRKGRQAMIQTIKRTKYKEINRENLLLKKSLPSVKFALEYQLHDLIGADLVKCIKSTTGILLRLVTC